MKIYRISVIITFVISILSLSLAMFLNYYEKEFVCNIFLGVFGSGLLTFISAVIGYNVEREKCFSNFHNEAIQLLRNFEKYDADDRIEIKVDFIVKLHDYPDKLFSYYKDFAFLFDFKKQDSHFIRSIMSNLKTLETTGTVDYWYYRGAIKQKNIDNHELEEKIKTFENLLFNGENAYSKIDLQEDIDISTNKKAVKRIYSALNRKYYLIWLGKIKYKKYVQRQERYNVIDKILNVNPL